MAVAGITEPIQLQFGGEDVVELTKCDVFREYRLLCSRNNECPVSGRTRPPNALTSSHRWG
jgi:hypothetical protein